VEFSKGSMLLGSIYLYFALENKKQTDISYLSPKQKNSIILSVYEKLKYMGCNIMQHTPATSYCSYHIAVALYPVLIRFLREILTSSYNKCQM
jgi:hypothetical protein